jgi:hypothetical protein
MYQSIGEIKNRKISKRYSLFQKKNDLAEIKVDAEVEVKV